MSTVERAYTLARTGRYRTLTELKARLAADGCRAIDVQLAPRSVRGHLEAICAAAYKPAPAEQAAPELETAN